MWVVKASSVLFTMEVGSNQGVHERASSAILDAAAAVLCERGGGASMGDMACAAGVSRATLYRYFPRREDLLQALLDAAVDEAHHRIIEAGLGEVEVPEAVARMARALVASGTHYAVLFVEGASIDPKEVEFRLGAIMQDVFTRGMKDGSLRADLSPETLLHLFGGLLKAAVRMTTVEGFGVERAAAAITSVFLNGARSPGCIERRRAQPAPAPGS